MYDDDSFQIFIFIAIIIISIFGIGYATGFSMGEQFSQKETINFCIEKPTDCKTKYDYFKLENQK